MLATGTAADAARRMHAALSGDIQARLRQAIQLGQRLSDPTVWDGTAAASFRRTWPQESARLESTLRTLEALQGRAQDVIQAIEKAGTDGNLGGGGSQNGASWENTFGNVTSLVGTAGWFGAPVVSTLLGRAEHAEEAAEEAAKANETIERLMYEDFAGRVRPVMQAMSRGEATFEDLSRAVRGTEETVAEWSAALKVNTAFREGFEEAARGIGWFRGADMALGPLAMISDVSTLWHPNGHGTMAWVDRGAAAVDLGLTGADTGIAVAGLFGVEAAMPGIGEVAMLGTGAYLVGSYLYQHWTPFRDVANDVGHAVAGVARGAWHAISSIF